MLNGGALHRVDKSISLNFKVALLNARLEGLGNINTLSDHSAHSPSYSLKAMQLTAIHIRALAVHCAQTKSSQAVHAKTHTLAHMHTQAHTLDVAGKWGRM